MFNAISPLLIRHLVPLIVPPIFELPYSSYQTFYLAQLL
jgi:hypothetical protein